MFKVVIEGFKSRDEAFEFCNWYRGQGEQDIGIWMECRQDEGKDVRTSLYCYGILDDPKESEDTVFMTLTPPC